MKTRFRDRTEAGRLLGGMLRKYANQPRVLVLALPRGGVPVAFEIARSLRAPLDVLVVRKLGVPGREELAMGAIASGGMEVLNEGVIRELAVPAQDLAAAVERERSELARRERAWRGHDLPLAVRGRTVILVDDGIATGATMRVALKALRRQKPARLIVAVPVAAPDAAEAVRAGSDEFVAVLQPAGFSAVGEWYEGFPQVDDEEVRALLDQARGLPAGAGLKG